MRNYERYRLVKFTEKGSGDLVVDRYICVDPEGIPFGYGTRFIEWAVHVFLGCLIESACNYMDQMCNFLTYIDQQHYDRSSYLLHPIYVRKLATEYFEKRMGLSVVPHHNGNLNIKDTKNGVTLATARLSLQGLRLFYEFLIWEKVYNNPNPFSWKKGILKNRQNFVPKSPVISGTTNPRINGRMPETYFCVVKDKWEPKSIDNPSLKGLLVPHFLALGDRIITRILFEGGPRIKEVLLMDVGDWRKLHGKHPGAWATNKGSNGMRVKQVYWSVETDRMLYHYFHYDRREMDRFGRDLADLPDDEPIFINRLGNRQSYSDYRYEWVKVCVSISINMTIHQTRHWFSTEASKSLRVYAKKSCTDVEILKKKLIDYMHWDNPDTIKYYEHIIDDLEAPEFFDGLSNAMKANNKSQNITPSSVRPTNHISAEMIDFFETLERKFEEEDRNNGKNEK